MLISGSDMVVVIGGGDWWGSGVKCVSAVGMGIVDWLCGGGVLLVSSVMLGVVLGIAK